MPGEVSLEEYSSPLPGYREGELASQVLQRARPVWVWLTLGVGTQWRSGGWLELVRLRNPGLTLEGRFPRVVAGARLVSRPGPSSVAIVLFGSSQQPARRNVAWTVSQGM